MGDVVAHPGWGFRIMSMLTFTTGTAFMMWVGEQITERGIGNGISLIIFAGIVDGIPAGVFNYFATNKGNIQPLNLAAVAFIVVATVATIVFFERGQRKIPIQYARRTVGKTGVWRSADVPPAAREHGRHHPADLRQLAPDVPGDAREPARARHDDLLQQALSRGDWLFNVFYICLIVFFCYFYTAVTFQAVDVADNLKKQQAFIPSIRQGKQTADYIDFVLTRITLGGADVRGRRCASCRRS